MLYEPALVNQIKLNCSGVLHSRDITHTNAHLTPDREVFHSKLTYQNTSTVRNDLQTSLKISVTLTNDEDINSTAPDMYFTHD